LPAGHYAVLSQRGLEVHRYWSLPTQPPPHRNHGNFADAANALESGLREAVASRLISDVPLGCFLSGGTDSSLVAALAQESLGSKLKTYTVGFESSTMNEAGQAAKVAKHLGTDHHELMVSPNSVVTEFEPILSKSSEPIGDDSFVPTHIISRETRRHVTVALSGDGGDELFAGYAKYRQFQLARLMHRWLPAPWGMLANLPLSDHFRKSTEAMAVKSPLELARWLSSLWKRQELGNLLAEPLQGELTPDLFARQWRLRKDFSEMERWMLADMETYLEGDILPKVDRASMAVGLETRCPFLDHQFVEQTLQWHCHADAKSGGKRILRQMLAKRLPKALFERPKQGFGMPIELWYREPLREMLLRYTDPKRIRQRGLLNEATVISAVHQHLSGRRNFARKLHAIVAFEIWAEQFFGKDCALV
jgi:asparagine synthase (glutamine-hydrolysing)